MPADTMDMKGALERALAALNGDDPTARNDARVLLEMATVFRHGVSIRFEHLAIATEDTLGDALTRDAAVFGMNAHLRALRREADWESIDAIETYILDQARKRRTAVRDNGAAELFRLINDGDLDRADELHARLTEEGVADPAALDDARTAIDNRRWETSNGLR